jgi:acyl-CoA synthetase (AMP-forming)/AMP-acid ligase II
MRGGVNIILRGFRTDEFLSTVERHGVTATAMVPTIIYTLLDDPRVASADLSSLRTVVYAGSPVQPARIRQAIDRFGPIFVQAYAGTEPGYVSCLRKEDHRAEGVEALRRLASAGRPMFHVDVSIQDEAGNEMPIGEPGEVCVHSPGQMTRYWEPQSDGEGLRGSWVRSGDVGYMDADAFLFLVDRVKDMIVTGGLNVFPRQIEEVLGTHPGVAQCAVIGVPDDRWGEAVKAIVVLRRGQQATEEELLAWVRERKGGVVAPKSVDFVSELPLTPAGKVDKKALRKPYWAVEPRSIH